MTDPRVPAVQAEGLVKHFDGKEDMVEAVRGVDLEIQPGEIFDWGAILPGFAVVAGLGVIMLLLNIRMIQTYD